MSSSSLKTVSTHYSAAFGTAQVMVEPLYLTATYFAGLRPGSDAVLFMCRT